MNKNIILKITCLLAIVLFIGTIGVGIGQADDLMFQLGVRNGVAPVGEFRADVNGVDVSFDWSAMVTADSYTMAVALSDEFGDPDIGSLKLLDMGNQKNFSTFGLSSGMIFYAAILAHTAQGLVVSNSLSFMPFAGVVTYPQVDSIFMQIDDSGGIGTLKVYGSPDGVIERITGDDGTGPFIFTVFDGKPATYTKGDLAVNFINRSRSLIDPPLPSVSRQRGQDDSDCIVRVKLKMIDLVDKYEKERLAHSAMIHVLLQLSGYFPISKGTQNAIFLASLIGGARKDLTLKFAQDRARLEDELEACSKDPVNQDPDPNPDPDPHTPVILDLQKFIKDITDDFDELFAAYNKCPATANQPDFKKLRIELGVGTLYCGYKSGVRKDLQIDLGSGDGWARFSATYNNDGSISASYHTHETQLSVRFFGSKCTYIRLFKEEPLYSPYMLRYVNPQDPDSNIIFEQNIFMDGGG